MQKFDRYVKKARALGFTRAKIIDSRTVATANWVRMKCQYGCGGFGKYLTCPPFSPDPVLMRKILKDYRWGILLLVENIPPAKEDRIWRKIKRAVATLERDFFLDGFYKAYGLTTGPCCFCPVCNTTTRCRFPDLARPSMEACGIDVYKTIHNNGWKLAVVKTNRSPCTYVSLVLIE